MYLGLTDGGYTGLTDQQIIASLLTTPDDTTDDTTDSAEPDAAAGGEPGANVAADTDRAAAAADEQPAAQQSTAGRNADDTITPEPTEPDHRQDESVPDEGSLQRRGGVELRVRLSTLLGHDRYPGEIAGWGPIHAELARTLATRLARGQWRWVLTDTHGQLLDAGTTRTRPAGARRTGVRTRDVVELQLPASLLTVPGAEQLGPWALLVADITRQHAAQHPSGQRFTGDTHRRRPGAAQRRWLQARDRHCVRPGCRAPARDTQQDHTVDHAVGGPTLDHNLGGLCPHDHQVKTEGGWDLTQHQPGHFRWTSNLGHSYEMPPRPITEPLPDPIPRRRADPDPPPLPPEGDWEHDHILEHPPPEPEPPPPTRADDPDEPPPF